MNLDKYKEANSIVRLEKSDKDFLKSKAIEYLNNATITFPLFIFFGTLVGIYHFNFWNGFIVSLLLFFLYEGKSILKVLPVLIGLLSNKKIVGIGKVTYRINKNENYFSRAIKVNLDKSHTIFIDSNEGYGDILEKIKIGDILYLEITNYSNIVLVIKGHKALNKKRKKKK